MSTADETTSAGKLWDKGVALDELVERYTVGDDPILDLELVRFDILGSLAHARGLREIGLLSQEELTALHHTLLAILKTHEAGGFSISSSQEDVHTAVEARLTAKLGDVGRKLHTGRSRNDQVLVDTRLWSKDACIKLTGQTLELARALLALGREHATLPLPGFTHLRAAMPSSVGLWTAGFAAGLLSALPSLRATFDQVNRCPLGSAAGYGVPLPLPRGLVAELLGFRDAEPVVTSCQPSRGRDAAALLFACVLLAREGAAFSWDGILFSDEQRGLMKLPDAFTTGSSIMPQKKNPDVLELTRGRLGRVEGALQECLRVGSGLPSGYHRDYQLLKQPLFRGVRETSDGLAVLAHVVPGLTFDAERCVAACTGTINATHRALELVGEGVPFRHAYRQVADEVAGGALSTRAPQPLEGTSRPDNALDRLEEELEDWSAWLHRVKSHHQAALAALLERSDRA